MTPCLFPLRTYSKLGSAFNPVALRMVKTPYLMAFLSAIGIKERYWSLQILPFKTRLLCRRETKKNKTDRVVSLNPIAPRAAKNSIEFLAVLIAIGLN